MIDTEYIENKYHLKEDYDNLNEKEFDGSKVREFLIQLGYNLSKKDAYFGHYYTSAKTDYIPAWNTVTPEKRKKAEEELALDLQCPSWEKANLRKIKSSVFSNENLKKHFYKFSSKRLSGNRNLRAMFSNPNIAKTYSCINNTFGSSLYENSDVIVLDIDNKGDELETAKVVNYIVRNCLKEPIHIEYNEKTNATHIWYSIEHFLKETFLQALKENLILNNLNYTLLDSYVENRVFRLPLSYSYTGIIDYNVEKFDLMELTDENKSNDIMKFIEIQDKKCESKYYTSNKMIDHRILQFLNMKNTWIKNQYHEDPVIEVLNKEKNKKIIPEIVKNRPKPEKINIYSRKQHSSGENLSDIDFSKFKITKGNRTEVQKTIASYCYMLGKSAEEFDNICFNNNIDSTEFSKWDRSKITDFNIKFYNSLCEKFANDMSTLDQVWNDKKFTSNLSSIKKHKYLEECITRWVYSNERMLLENSKYQEGSRYYNTLKRKLPILVKELVGYAIYQIENPVNFNDNSKLPEDTKSIVSNSFQFPMDYMVDLFKHYNLETFDAWKITNILIYSIPFIKQLQIPNFSKGYSYQDGKNFCRCWQFSEEAVCTSDNSYVLSNFKDLVSIYLSSIFYKAYSSIDKIVKTITNILDNQTRNQESYTLPINYSINNSSLFNIFFNVLFKYEILIDYGG